MNETINFLITSGVVGFVINLATFGAKYLSVKLPFTLNGQTVLAATSVLVGIMYGIISLWIPESFKQNIIAVTITAMTLASGVYGITKPLFKDEPNMK